MPTIAILQVNFNMPEPDGRFRYLGEKQTDGTYKLPKLSAGQQVLLQDAAGNNVQATVEDFEEAAYWLRPKLSTWRHAGEDTHSI